MSKKRGCGVGAPTAKRIHSGYKWIGVVRKQTTTTTNDNINNTVANTSNDSGCEQDRLWRIVTDYPDIFDNFILPKLNGNDIKFFYDVNTESRVAIKRSSGRLCATFKICDFDTKSTLSWALEKCSEEKERFCDETARKGNLELLQYLHETRRPSETWVSQVSGSLRKLGQKNNLTYIQKSNDT